MADAIPFHSPDTAPFIYFDLTAACGTIGGAIQIELASRILVPTEDGGARAEFVVTGRLRCSPTALGALRETIDKSFELLKQAQEQPGGAPVAASKLN